MVLRQIAGGASSGDLTVTSPDGTVWSITADNAGALATSKVDNTVPDVPQDGLTLWEDARTLALADGAAVSSWPSAVGTLAPGQATAGSQPLFQAADATGPDRVVFDGVDDFLSQASVLGSDLFGSAEMTLFILQKQYGVEARNTSFFWDATASVNLHATYDDTIIFDFAGPTKRTSIAQPAGWDDAWKIVECSRESGTGVQSVIVDGVTLASGPTTGTISLTTAATLFVVGQATSFGGEMAQLLVWNRYLTTAEREQVRAYLAALIP